MSTTQDRIDVMVAIDRFIAMANAAPWQYETLPHPVFTADSPGPKFTRIVQAHDEEGRGRSVHCFVDNVTGDVYKAAGWKAPAKGVRYNLLTYFAEVERNFDLYGSYLYADYRKR